MPRWTRMVLILLLAALPAAPVTRAQALPAGRSLELAESASSGLFSRLWRLLAQAWSENGCEFDPSGRCLLHESGPASEGNGCQADPNGRCQEAKNGCQLDPNGRCQEAKNGCQLDPDGACI